MRTVSAPRGIAHLEDPPVLDLVARARGSVATGDAWLSTWLGAILASPAYQGGGTAVFVTYDENDDRADNHVYTVVVAPSVRPGTTSGARFDHYSLFATFEDLLGLDRLAGAAPAASMRSAFNL